jgi:hypothetical protein
MNLDEDGVHLMDYGTVLMYMYLDYVAITGRLSSNFLHLFARVVQDWIQFQLYLTLPLVQFRLVFESCGS